MVVLGGGEIGVCGRFVVFLFFLCFSFVFELGGWRFGRLGVFVFICFHVR